MPVRLETRFVRPVEGAAPGTDDAKWRLRVRVEPDPVSLPVGGRAATEHDAEQVAGFWTACNGDLSTPEAEAAFASLAGRVGAARAAYLLRTVAVDHDNGGFRVDPDAGPGVVPPVLGLPRQLEIWGDGVRLATLQPQHDEIRGTSDLAAVRPDADGTIPRTWWNSYSEAENVGLACEILLGETRPFFDTLLCIGLNQSSSEEPLTRQVFEAHAAAGTLATLAPLTPTNTVDGQPTVDLGRDPAPWLGVARQPLGDVAGLTALTGTPLLEGVPAPDTTRHDTAGALVRSLWPVLWQRSLKDIGDLGEEVYRLGEYAGRHLHPFGPFPVLRVGDLPYGVLPVSVYAQWTRAADDPPFEGTQVPIGIDHVDVLASAAGDDLTAKDADAERLLRVLAQTPTAREYGSRHLPPTVLWAAFQALIEGIDPAEVVARWDAQAAPAARRARARPAASLLPAALRRAVAGGRASGLPEDDGPVSPRHVGRARGGLRPQPALDGCRRARSPHALARLVRQSLLLTTSEVCRLFTDQEPRPATDVVPAADQRPAADVRRRDRLHGTRPGPRAAASRQSSWSTAAAHAAAPALRRRLAPVRGRPARRGSNWRPTRRSPRRCSTACSTRPATGPTCGSPLRPPAAATAPAVARDPSWAPTGGSTRSRRPTTRRRRPAPGWSTPRRTPRRSPPPCCATMSSTTRTTRAGR